MAGVPGPDRTKAGLCIVQKEKCTKEIKVIVVGHSYLTLSRGRARGWAFEGWYKVVTYSAKAGGLQVSHVLNENFHSWFLHPAPCDPTKSDSYIRLCSLIARGPFH